MPKIIAQGAEAKIILANNFIIKDRISKPYRLKVLDDKIRKLRTRSEAKLLEKASQIINSPKPFFQPCIEGTSRIKMPFIKGKKLSENLDSLSLTKQKQILNQIGKEIAKLHDANIIHGDLTTSNMILVEDFNNKSNLNKKISKNNVLTSKNKYANVNEPNMEWGGGNKPIIFFIDFGLGFISHKIEDKAVDIHLLNEAIEAKHFKFSTQLKRAFLRGYKSKSKDFLKIMERLKAVEKRGRYKERY